jgi:hypothetical protein
MWVSYTNYEKRTGRDLASVIDRELVKNSVRRDERWTVCLVVSIVSGLPLFEFAPHVFRSTQAVTWLGVLGALNAFWWWHFWEARKDYRGLLRWSKLAFWQASYENKVGSPAKAIVFEEDVPGAIQDLFSRF